MKNGNFIIFYLQSQNCWIFLILSKIRAIYFFFLHIFPSLFIHSTANVIFFSFVPLLAPKCDSYIFYSSKSFIYLFIFILIPLINNFNLIVCVLRERGRSDKTQRIFLQFFLSNQDFFFLEAKRLKV